MYTASIYQIKGEIARGNNTIPSLRAALEARYYDSFQVFTLINGLIRNGFILVSEDGILSMSSKEYRLKQLKKRGVI